MNTLAVASMHGRAVLCEFLKRGISGEADQEQIDSCQGSPAQSRNRPGYSAAIACLSGVVA